MKSLLLMQALDYDARVFNLAGAYVSEKFDGMRCWWDGGITRGMKKRDVPWGNTNQRGERISTGLWTRYGNTIFAPDWWLDKLPPVMLDGELWAGRKNFQQTRSIASRLPENALDWTPITYQVFDMPDLAVLKPRKINLTHYKIDIPDSTHLTGNMFVPSGKDFTSVQAYLRNRLKTNSVFKIAEQQQLPWNQESGRRILNELLHEYVDADAEAVMIREPYSHWVPHRVSHIAKYKLLNDTEAVVVGYRAAKAGKMLGLIGSLIVKAFGKQFELSGMNYGERVLRPCFDRINCEGTTIRANQWCLDHPGKVVPSQYNGNVIKRGDKVTFRYKDFTEDGIPKEARYWRCR